MIPQYRVTWTELKPTLTGEPLAINLRGRVYDNFSDAERERMIRSASGIEHYGSSNGNDVVGFTRYYHNVRIEARVKSEEPWE